MTTSQLHHLHALCDEVLLARGDMTKKFYKRIRGSASTPLSEGFNDYLSMRSAALLPTDDVNKGLRKMTAGHLRDQKRFYKGYNHDTMRTIPSRYSA